MIRGDQKTISLRGEKQLFLTTQISMFEVIRGLFYRQMAPAKIHQIMDMFENIRVLQLDDSAVIKAAEISAGLMKKGEPVPDADCLIAGIALSKGVSTIITKNVKHFSRIKGLTVETY